MLTKTKFIAYVGWFEHINMATLVSKQKIRGCVYFVCWLEDPVWQPYGCCTSNILENGQEKRKHRT